MSLFSVRRLNGMAWRDLGRRFRHLFKENFSRIFSKRPDPSVIREEEVLSRFINSTSHYRKEKKRVLYGAFLPTRNGETSVFRTSDLAESAIWSLAQEQLAPRLPSGRRIHGRGDIEVSGIRSTGLRVEPEVSTHHLHANILGWPSEKEKQRLFAGELALRATLRLLEE